MTDAGSVAIPLDAFQDPVLAYAVEGRDARVTAANDAFERRFDARSSGTSVSTIFGRFPTIDTTADEEPLTHLVRGDRVGIYLDGYRDHGPYFVRVIPSDGTTGYLVFSDLAQCPNLGESPAIDQVSRVISHDLRNPLDVAKAHLQAARETGDAKHFDSVSNAHDRMERIIRDVLTLTREDAVVDPSQQVSIETAARDAWQSVETDHATLDLPDSLPTTTADPDRVRRLFENLFRNSVEHSATSSRAEPGDSVEHGPEVGDISARGDEAAPEGDVTITVGPLADGFYVADDGPGISPEERADVFEPGYSNQDGGTGLGLAIVERIVVAHDWELRLTAAELGGVRFEIQF
jgi:signal transduction histidine kinase